MTAAPSPARPSVARRMWEAVERFHGVCYTAPEPREAATGAGLKGFWMAYFATRAAPMGPVPPEVVQSTFFYYSPVRVWRAIPDAWSFSTPERVLTARYAGITAAFERILGREPSDAVREAAELTERAVEGGDVMGRTLFAAWSSLPWPDEPYARLWHGCTLLREHRSGSHLLALAAHGLDGCQSVVSQVAVDDAPRDWIGDEAAWSASDEAAAVDALRERGWLDADGAATGAGRTGRAAVEALTDELDARLWRPLGDAACDRLVELLTPIHAELPPDDQLDWQTVYQGSSD